MESQTNKCVVYIVSYIDADKVQRKREYMDNGLGSNAQKNAFDLAERHVRHGRVIILFGSNPRGKAYRVEFPADKAAQSLGAFHRHVRECLDLRVEYDTAQEVLL